MTTFAPDDLDRLILQRRPSPAPQLGGDDLDALIMQRRPSSPPPPQTDSGPNRVTIDSPDWQDSPSSESDPNRQLITPMRPVRVPGAISNGPRMEVDASGRAYDPAHVLPTDIEFQTRTRQDEARYAASMAQQPGVYGRFAANVAGGVDEAVRQAGAGWSGVAQRGLGSVLDEAVLGGAPAASPEDFTGIMSDSTREANAIRGEAAGATSRFVAGLASMPATFLDPKTIAAMLISHSPSAATSKALFNPMAMAAIEKKFGTATMHAVQQMTSNAITGGGFGGAHAAVTGGDVIEGVTQGAAASIPFGVAGTLGVMAGERAGAARMRTAESNRQYREDTGRAFDPSAGRAEGDQAIGVERAPAIPADQPVPEAAPKTGPEFDPNLAARERVADVQPDQQNPAVVRPVDEAAGRIPSDRQSDDLPVANARDVEDAVQAPKPTRHPQQMTNPALRAELEAGKVEVPEGAQRKGTQAADWSAGKSLPELRKLAREAGVSDRGNRPGLIKAIEGKRGEIGQERYFQRVAREAAERIQARKAIPRGKDTGGGTLHEDVIDAGIWLAAKFGDTGDRFFRSQMGYARKLIDENYPHLADHFGDVSRMARKLLREGADPAAKVHKYDDARFEASLGKVLEDRKGPDRPIKQVIRESTGQRRVEEKTITASEALVAGLKREERTARKAYEEGKRLAAAEARNRLDVLTTKLQSEMESSKLRVGMTERAKGELGLEKEKARTARMDEMRKEALQLVRRHAPLSVRGKLLEAVTRATTPHRLMVVARRLRKERALLEARRAYSGAEKVTKTDLSKLEPEMKETAQAAKQEIRDAHEALKAAEKGNRAKPEELEVIRDRLVSSLKTIKSLLYEQKHLDTVRIRGEVVEAAKYRGEVVDSLKAKKELPKADQPQSPEPSGMVRFLRRRTNWESLMNSLDGFKAAGPATRLFNQALRGRRESLRLGQEFQDGLSKIVTQNGYKSLGRFQAELSGTLGRASQKMVPVKIGSHERLTMGQASYLYAASSDAGFRARIENGQKMQFREDPTGLPFAITRADLERVAAALPENVKKIIDQSKALYDSHYFQRMSNVNKRLKGVHLDKVDGYWGIKLNRQYSEGKGTPNAWRGQAIRAMEEAGFMQERLGPSKTPMMIGDFGVDIMLRSKAAATTIGKAEITKLMTRVLLHPDVMTAVADRFGRSAVERIERRLSLYSGGDLFREADQPALRMIQAMWARGKTQLWIPTWIRNATAGSMRVLDELGPASLIRSALPKFGKPTWREFQDLMQHSPELRERWEGRSLSAFYDAGSQHGAEARFTQAMGATARQLGEMVKSAAQLKMHEAASAFMEAGKPWGAMLDAMTIGNYFDAVPAVLAYRTFLRRAPKNLSEAAAKRWAARHATRVFERVSNTATIEYANDIQLDARDSFIIASFIPFTGDTAKAQNMIYRSAHKDAKAMTRTAATVALSAGASALVTYLWAKARGDKEHDAMTSAEVRLAQEFAGLIPGIGPLAAKGVERAVKKYEGQKMGPFAPEVQLPVLDGANNLLDLGMHAYDAVEKGDRGGVLKEHKRWTQVRDDAISLIGDVLGVPTQYLRETRKVLENWGQ